MTTTAHNDQLVELLFNLSRMMKDDMTFDSDTSQLTLLQLQALIYIKKNSTVSMSDLANKFAITMPTATALSDKLVNISLVQRTQSETDRRVTHLSLTTKGEQLLKEAMRQRSLKINKTLSYLSREDKQHLFTILSRLFDTLKADYEK